MSSSLSEKADIDKLDDDIQSLTYKFDAHEKIEEHIMTELNKNILHILEELKIQNDKFDAQSRHFIEQQARSAKDTDLKIAECYKTMRDTLKEDYATKEGVIIIKDEALATSKIERQAELKIAVDGAHEAVRESARLIQESIDRRFNIIKAVAALAVTVIGAILAFIKHGN